MKNCLKQIGTVVVGAFLFMSCGNDNTTTDYSDKSTTTAHDSSGTGTADTQMDHKMNENKMMMCMDRMANKMKEVKMTGDFDIDFANTMIEHHKGGIEMSEEELKSGTDEKMKAMAQKIIDAQKGEVDQLQDFVKNYKPSGMKHGEGELTKLMNDVHGKMSGMQMSGDADKDFATMMVDHHTNAVSMSKKELENGMSARLKKMAQKMIIDQQKEIKEFNDWLNSKK